MPLDPQRFRATFRDAPTSVAVVTSVDEDGVPHGMTIGSLSALSLAPPLLLCCVARGAGSHAAICRADRYCISLLAEEHEAVARRFAQRAEDRFGSELADFEGLPAVPGALGWLLCVRERLVDAGDRTIAMARVDRATTRDRPPLLYWRRGYRALQHAQPDYGAERAAASWRVMSRYKSSSAMSPATSPPR
jgi:flavin reductase (DIM6/NTAB) family NADH-FMN oxidoreductase RutF